MFCVLLYRIQYVRQHGTARFTLLYFSHTVGRSSKPSTTFSRREKVVKVVLGSPERFVVHHAWCMAKRSMVECSLKRNARSHERSENGGNVTMKMSFTLLAASLLLAACGGVELTPYPASAVGAGGWSGGVSSERSKERSGELNPGEVVGPEGTDDTGNGVGFAFPVSG